MFGFTLDDGGGNPIDLTGSTIKFHMRLSGQPIKVNAAAVVNPDQVTYKGQGWYPWIAADTDTIGEFQAEVRVTYSTGKVETFPNNSYWPVYITAELTD
jgi:hypothetical protein